MVRYLKRKNSKIAEEDNPVSNPIHIPVAPQEVKKAR
jgi:hypothetical protein